MLLLLVTLSELDYYVRGLADLSVLIAVTLSVLVTQSSVVRSVLGLYIVAFAGHIRLSALNAIL